MRCGVESRHLWDGSIIVDTQYYELYLLIKDCGDAVANKFIRSTNTVHRCASNGILISAAI